MQFVAKEGCTACGKLAKQLTKSLTYVNLQHIRQTCVFQHEHYVPERKRGDNPDLLLENYNVYKMVVNENQKARSDIKCLLTGMVDGVGFPGQILTVKRKLFRKALYPAGLAVYPTPENIAEVTETLKKTGEIDKYKNFSPFTRKILKEIVGLNLPIGMNPSQEWVLDKSHVKVALRNQNIECTDENSIILPEDPVTGVGEIQLSITINKIKTVKFRATVYHLPKDESEAESVPQIKIWGNKPLEYDPLLA